MRLTLLGTGDAFCTGGRFNTCLMLEAGGTAMLVDCGATSMLALNRAGIDRNRLSTILFTHFHGDHFGGLPFFLLDAMFVARRTAPLEIVGPRGVEARARAAIETAFPGYWAAERHFSMTFREIEAGTRADVAGFDVTAFAMVHNDNAGPCLGYRFARGGKVLAFSGDTAWTEALVPLADGADVLLCECYTALTILPNHLDWETLAARRADLRAKRLIVTHMGPEMLAFTDEIPAERAFDGMEVAV